jgi:hypothetical protein
VQDSYRRAQDELVRAIRDGLPLEDDTLEGLLAGQDTIQAKKRLTVGLKTACLISADQAAMRVYRRPGMREA